MAVPIITPDVVHPATTSWSQWEPDAPYVMVGMTRVFLVQQIDAITLINSPWAVVSGALYANGLPKAGSNAPDPNFAKYGCVALNYRTIVIPQSDDSVYVVVEYRSPVPRANGGGPPILVVTNETELESDITNVFPDTKEPMSVTWTDKNDKNSTFTIPAQFRAETPLRKLVLSGYAEQKDIDLFGDFVGYINKVPWWGKDVGFWKFWEFRTEGTRFSDVYRVTVGLLTRGREPWWQWDFARNDQALGKILAPDAGEIKKVMAQGYQYGFYEGNGFTVMGRFPPQDFKVLFGIDSHQDQNQQLSNAGNQ